MPRYKLRTLLILLALGPPGCSTERTADNFQRAVREAEEVVLYEGLPHPEYEYDSFETQKNSKPVVQIAGYFFYRPPLELKAGEGQSLQRILSDRTTFEPFEGEKKCGGFHPDYAVEVVRASSRYRFLICFGCGEIKVVSLRATLRYDMGGDATRQLSELLRPYRQNRPDSKFSHP